MKYFFDFSQEIIKRIQGAKDCALMFDFDGTLSKIAKTPREAFLEKSTKDLIKKLNKNFCVAVVSGRDLSSVKSMIGLPGLIYAGNHGLEWQIGKKSENLHIDKKFQEDLAQIKNIFKSVAVNYPGISIEDKLSNLSIHYRLLSEKACGDFLKKIKENILAVNKEGFFSVTKGKKVIEIRPKVAWDKGAFAKFLLQRIKVKNRHSCLAFYIGDDKTDEDAFVALSDGITIRIGKNKKSAAKYYIKNQKQIDKLLLWLLKNISKDSN